MGKTAAAKGGIKRLEGMLNKTFGLEKPVKKPEAKKEPTREELRHIVATEKPASTKGYQAAVKLLGHIEKEIQSEKTRKVVYFPKVVVVAPVKQPEETTKPVTQPKLAKAVEKKTEKVHPKLAKQVKARELPEVPQVTLAEICKKLKLDPAEVRKALRDKKVPKPGAQWSWPASETPRLWKLVEKTHKDWIKEQK